MAISLSFGTDERDSVSLTKGGVVDLSKEEPTLDIGRACLGWQPRITDGADFDLDVSAILLTASGKARGSDDFCYHKHPVSAGGAVEHMGDNLTGAGATRDKEQIRISFNRIPAEIEKIAIIAAIHLANERKQNFGMVEGAFIRLINEVTNREIATYDLTEESSVYNTLVMGELYRRGTTWKFRSIEAGYNGRQDDISGLAEVVRMYGLGVKKEPRHP